MRKNPGSPIYPRHRLETLEPFYSRHVSAMTTEELHHKGDIAEQLAWRDKKLAELEDLVGELHTILAKRHNADIWPLAAALEECSCEAAGDDPFCAAEHGKTVDR